MITLNDFSSGLADPYPFGMSNASTAAALRKLADCFESGEALPSSVTLHSRTSGDDFHQTTLVLKMTNRLPPPG